MTLRDLVLYTCEVCLQPLTFVDTPKATARAILRHEQSRKHLRALAAEIIERDRQWPLLPPDSPEERNRDALQVAILERVNRLSGPVKCAPKCGCRGQR